MIHESVGTQEPYEVFIGRGSLSKSGDFIREGLGIHRIALLSDETVDRLYGDKAEKILCRAGHAVTRISYALPIKDETASALLSRLAAFTAEDLIVVLGGCDAYNLAGSCTAESGMRLVLIPSTLSAALICSVARESSGESPAFRPSMVFCDPTLFSTLPEEVYADGIAEAIRFGVVFDRSLFRLLYSDFDVSEVIRRCVRIKADVAAADRAGVRASRLLQFGQTAAQAIELLSEHEFSHGQANAVAMVIMTRLALRIGFCKENFLGDLIGNLNYRGLPTSVLCTPDELIAAMASSAPEGADTLELVLPRRLGECALCPITLSQLARLLKV